MSKKQIVFAEGFTTAFTFKLAKILKRKGYETVLIVLLGDPSIKYGRQEFDKIINLDARFMKANLKNLSKIIKYSLSKHKEIAEAIKEIRKLKPYVVIGRATPNWLWVLFRKKFRKYPFIYFPYDIRSFGFKNVEHAKKLGVPKFELKAEKYCFEHADGIIHKGDENELKYLNENVIGKVNIKAPVLHFPPYCDKDYTVPINKNKLPKKNKEIHLVFVGHVVTNIQKKEDSWEESIAEILKQKMHLHIYGKTAYLSDEELKKNFFKSYLTKFIGNKYFHTVFKTMGYKKLIKEISKYDFGIWMGYGYEKTKHIGFGSGNKMATYLEAGLPFVYYKNHWFIDKLMTKYGLKLAVTPDEIKNLKKTLKKINYERYLKNVVMARRDFEIKHNLPRLEKFFKEVREYKFKNSSS